MAGDPAVEAAQAKVDEAGKVVAANDGAVKLSWWEQLPRLYITAVIIIVWAGLVAVMVFWAALKDPGSSKYVCNTPPVGGSTIGTDCTSAWASTRDSLKDILTTGVLPLVTLVLGFYFGKQTAGPGDGTG